MADDVFTSLALSAHTKLSRACSSNNPDLRRILGHCNLLDSLSAEVMQLGLFEENIADGHPADTSKRGDERTTTPQRHTTRGADHTIGDDDVDDWDAEPDSEDSENSDSEDSDSDSEDCWCGCAFEDGREDGEIQDPESPEAKMEKWKRIRPEIIKASHVLLGLPAKHHPSSRRRIASAVSERPPVFNPLADPIHVLAMLWYLLSPFQRTMGPATLRESHYLRRWMFYLGSVVAHHSLITIIVAVSIGFSLCLPVLVLSPSASSSYPKRPGPAWTLAESVANRDSLIPDISIKQAWIRGSWMKALERETLLNALAVQDVLFGSVSDCAMIPWHEDDLLRRPAEGKRPDSDASVSFLHSPLLYWNCSIADIESDDSIVSTVNSHAYQVSPADITLRPSSVLAGSVFSFNRVVAADALVVSLFYTAESRAGDLWDRRAEALNQYGKGGWKVSPVDSRETSSRLFTFHSRPISVQDKAIFFFACSLIAIYVVFNLRNLKILKSRVSLFMAIALQAFFSVVSGLTVAAFFHIDVSNIPPETYPFIVLILGLRNMFQLVREVEKTPLQDQPVHRIATAVGAVGHLSLIVFAQNLVILWLFSTITSPGIATFCGYAAVCLTLDLAFFFTFFVAMLTVDLRNYGLQDSFEDVRQRHKDSRSAKGASLNEPAQRQGRHAKRLPTHGALTYPRAMGSVIVISFICMLAWYFLEENIIYYLARMLAVLFDPSSFRTGRHSRHAFDSILEQSRRDATSWLEMQEQETTRELLRLANPHSHGFFARVYDPLVVVLKSADRNPSSYEGVSISSIDSIMSNQFWPSIVLFCFLLAFSLVVRNWCFSSDAPDEQKDRVPKRGGDSMIRYLPRGHSLDVFMLSASSKQYLVSVGFDHEIRLWNLVSENITSHTITPASEQHILWPVAAIAVDDKAEWIAICSKQGEVSLWSIKLQCFRAIIATGLNAHIVACFFTPSSHLDGLHPARRLLMVSVSGLLMDIEVETGTISSHQICTGLIRSSHISSHGRMPIRLITITKDEKIYTTIRREDYWTSQALHFSIPSLKPPARLRFTVIPDLRMVGLILNIDTYQLHLIDLISGAAIYTFRPNMFKHQTLRVIHSPPQQCLSCGAVALVSFSIAYTEQQDGSFTMCTLTAEENPRFRTSLICLRAERDVRERRCIGFGGSTAKTYTIEHAGVWDATAANGVAGMRRTRRSPKVVPNTSLQDRTLFRRRDRTVQRDPELDETWEAWTMTARGIVNVHTLSSSGLFTSRIGPVCPVGRNAIAVGLAEDLILVQFGSQLHDNDGDDDDNMSVRRLPRAKLAPRSRTV